MTDADQPAKRVTVLVAFAVVALLVLLLVVLVETAGFLGVGVFLGLVVGLVALAALVGVSLEVAFRALARATGTAWAAMARVGARLRR